MTYREATDFLFNSTPMFQKEGATAYKPGLDTTLALSETFGAPHKKLKCIIVGGTNGKGSTSHTIAAILQSSGYRTGLFTSPHLVDFRERIRIDGRMIPEGYVTDFVERFLNNNLTSTLTPSFFELTTVMALCWFVENQVDVAVLEVGLGGRLDCTNICSPDVSIITNISLDHTALLGSTEPEIAAEKAGIMRPGKPCVIGAGSPEVMAVFRQYALKTGAMLIEAQDNILYRSAALREPYIIYEDTPYGTLRGELTGDCQPENCNTILNAIPFLKKLYPAISDESISIGFSNVMELTGLRGRWEIIAREPVTVICDTGHNIGGWRYLGRRLRAFQPSTLHIVIGFVNDKDINAIMEQMPSGAAYYFTTPSVKRGRPANETSAIAGRHHLFGTCYENVARAFEAALRAARVGDTIFIGGSSFIVADFLASR